MQNEEINAVCVRKIRLKNHQKIYAEISARFSLLFVNIFFHADVVRAHAEYVSLFFVVRKSFHLFGIGKTRHGIHDGFTVLFEFAKFEIYLLLFGSCAERRTAFAFVIVFAKPCFCTFGKLPHGAIFMFNVAHIRLLFKWYHISLEKKDTRQNKTNIAIIRPCFCAVSCGFLTKEAAERSRRERMRKRRMPTLCLA